jgi:hypothetical protein
LLDIYQFHARILLVMLNFDETKEFDMTIFTLRNKFSSLLMTALMVMALSMMTGCSSTDDPAEDDAAAVEENCRATFDTVDEVEKCIRDNTP